MSTKLTARQENFCDAYFEAKGNATEAYRRAYNTQNMKYETISRRARELMANSLITARIAEIQGVMRSASNITKERILCELEAIAFSDIRDYVLFDGTDIRFKPFDELTDSQAKAIECIKNGKNGIELKLQGKSWTIERVCRMMGYDAPILMEQHTSTGLEEVADEELKERLMEMIK